MAEAITPSNPECRHNVARSRVAPLPSSRLCSSAVFARPPHSSQEPIDLFFTTDWQKTAQSRARIRDAIEETLDERLPRACTPDVLKTKAGVVFQHVYERYGRLA